MVMKNLAGRFADPLPVWMLAACSEQPADRDVVCYGSKEAGARFRAMLETGVLVGFLREQNQGRSCGW